MTHGGDTHEYENVFSYQSFTKEIICFVHIGLYKVVLMRADYEWFINMDFSKYAGKWIATLDKKVVVEGDYADAVYKEAKNKFPGKKPSLAKIPTGDTLVL
jgi:hypothetical protein